MHRPLLVLAALASLATPAATPAQSKKIRIAVLDIRPLGTEPAKAELLSEVALTEAASMPGVDVIGKSDINAMIGFEKQKKVMGCTDDSTCLAEIGGALGVDFILVGSLGSLGDLFRIDLKLVESKKAKVRARLGVTVEGKESKLVAAVQKAVRDLVGPEAPRDAALAARPVPAVAPDAAAEVAPAKAAPSLEAKPDAKAAAAIDGRALRPPSPGAATRAETGSRRKWAYVTGGAGLALLAGGALAGLQAKAAFDDEKAATTTAAYEDGKSKAKSMSTVADALFIGGGAGVAIGTWLFFTSRPAPLALEVGPVPGGAVALVSGGF